MCFIDYPNYEHYRKENAMPCKGKGGMKDMKKGGKKGGKKGKK